MGGNGDQSAYDTRANASRHDVHDVFDGGKAQADEGGVYDAVEIFVKVLVVPNEYHENQELAKFFGNACGDERVIENGLVEIGDESYGVVDDPDGDDGEHNGQHATEKGFEQRLEGFFLVFVLTINEYDQQGSWKHGEEQEYVVKQ